MQTKSYCEDITEGKYSFPIIHAIQSRREDTRLLSILRQRTADADVKRHAVQWMQQCGSLTHTRRALAELREGVLRELARLGGHARLEALIRQLDAQLGDDDAGGAEAATSSSSSSLVPQPLPPPALGRGSSVTDVL
jgi:geranylgeranyl diphosphate synthase type 3